MRNLLDIYSNGLTAAVLTTGLIIGGCGGGDETPEPTVEPTAEPTPEPTAEPTAEPTPQEDEVGVRILAPADGRLVQLTYNEKLSLPITFNINEGEFELTESAGECSVDNCGQVAVYVDGELNNTGFASPVSAYFADLADPADNHEVIVRLINHDGSDFINRGEVVEDSIGVVTTLPLDPAMTILTPTEDPENPVIPGNTENLPVVITFAATSVALVETAEDCGEAALCGQAIALLDGVPNNVEQEAFSSPLTVNMAEADAPEGTHTVTIRAVDFDGNPLTDLEGNNIEDTATFNVELPIPGIGVAGLQDGDFLHIDEGSNQLTGEIGYNVNAFLISTVDGCDALGQSECGEVWVKIDGDDGNGPNQSFNNATNANPAEAYFVNLDEPYGDHTVTLELRYHNGEPVMDEEGNPLTSSVDVFVVENAETTVKMTFPTTESEVAVNREAQPELQTVTALFNIGGDLRMVAPNDDGECPNGNDAPCGEGYATVSLDGQVLGQTWSGFYTMNVAEVADGEHTIEVRVYDNDDNLLSAQGIDAVDSVTFDLVTATTDETPE